MCWASSFLGDALPALSVLAPRCHLFVLSREGIKENNAVKVSTWGKDTRLQKGIPAALTRPAGVHEHLIPGKAEGVWPLWAGSPVPLRTAGCVGWVHPDILGLAPVLPGCAGVTEELWQKSTHTRGEEGKRRTKTTAKPLHLDSYVLPYTKTPNCKFLGVQPWKGAECVVLLRGSSILGDTAWAIPNPDLNPNQKQAHGQRYSKC